MTFEKELENLINRYSIEDESGTPDFLLAAYLRGCLNIFATTIQAREKWFNNQEIEIVESTNLLDILKENARNKQ